MRKLKHLRLIFTLTLLTAAFSTVSAQNEPAPVEETPPNANARNRPNLLAELDLSLDQIQQIRRVNRENQPLRRAAQQRLREANRRLDAAVYADSADETEIENSVKEAQTAQAEMIKLRSATEYAVRKILTPAQIIKFREIRERFTERMENAPKLRRQRRLMLPGQRLINRQRKLNSDD